MSPSVGPRAAGPRQPCPSGLHAPQHRHPGIALLAPLAGVADDPPVGVQALEGLTQVASPTAPTRSSTCSPRVTRLAVPLCSSSWTPSDEALHTGPGTPITTRLSRSAQEAVLRAPLRMAASTTTVPWVSAAMIR